MEATDKAGDQRCGRQTGRYFDLPPFSVNLNYFLCWVLEQTEKTRRHRKQEKIVDVYRYRCYGGKDKKKVLFSSCSNESFASPKALLVFSLFIIIYCRVLFIFVWILLLCIQFSICLISLLLSTDLCSSNYFYIFFFSVSTALIFFALDLLPALDNFNCIFLRWENTSGLIMFLEVYLSRTKEEKNQTKSIS